MGIKKVKRKTIFNLSEEDKARIKKNILEHRDSLSSEFQFGYYVGEVIYLTKLPTLSVYLIKSRKVIQVSEEDTQIHEKLHNEWFEQAQSEREDEKSEKWNKLKEYEKMLEKKYLPHKLTCFFPLMNIRNEHEFKLGLSRSLWNCDVCSYNIDEENIVISDDEDAFFTKIELTLGVLIDK